MSKSDSLDKKNMYQNLVGLHLIILNVIKLVAHIIIMQILSKKLKKIESQKYVDCIANVIKNVINIIIWMN